MYARGENLGLATREGINVRLKEWRKGSLRMNQNVRSGSSFAESCKKE